MEAESWHQVKEIVELAIEQPPDRREQFISERCSGDAALRSKIDSLISSYGRVGSFMEDGAIGSVAEMFTSSKNDLQTGDRLGRYRVVRVLGEGGMGRVYLADDLGLHRQVAIKVLRDDLWWYKQARQRLLREARAAARLDHPNICAIYEVDDIDGRSFIAMQYIEGETLADVMGRGGLRLRESISVALQIADALEEAHSHHIIHRDIKPANIILNEKRQAKVLDFGLAKSTEPQRDENENDLSSSGAVMGTVPYMSPEQLRGKTVDHRSDIFSFGALVFEMICGRQAFRRENNAETISAILNEQADLSMIPHRFRPVIERSLKKKADERYQTISEMAGELRKLVDDSLDDVEPSYSFSDWFGARGVISTAFRRYFSDRTGRVDTAGRRFYRWQDSDSDAQTVRLTESVSRGQDTERHSVVFLKRPVLLGGLGLLLVALIPAVIFWFIRPQSDPGSFDDMHLAHLVEWKEAGSNIYQGYSSSHNGKMIAYSVRQGDSSEAIYIKQIADSGDGVPVTKDRWGNHSPIWSPNDEKLAFVSYRNGSLGIYTVPFLGGETTLVKALEDGTISLRHWANDGSAIYYEFNGNLFRLDLASRDTKQITEFEPARSPERNFAFSPNEDRIVYLNQINGQTDLWIAPTKGGEPVLLTNDPEEESRPSWCPDGKGIFYDVIRDGYNQISVAYVDGGTPEQITRGEGEHLLIDVAAHPNRIFYTTWEDRSDVWGINAETGKEFQVADGREAEFWPDVSPDGKYILYNTNTAYHLMGFIDKSGITVRTIGYAGISKSFNGYDSRWLPDSRHIAFFSFNAAEERETLSIADTITGNTEPVITDGILSGGYKTLPYNRNQTRGFSWSPDCKEVTYISRVSGASNVHKKSLGESATISLSQNSDSSVTYYSPLFSPNGTRISYISIQKYADEGKKTVTSVWVAEGENTREVYSTTDGLRLLGWQGDETLIMESTGGVTKNGILKANPVDVRLIRLSVTNVSQSIAILKDIYADSATLSADGKTVAFTVRQNDRDDVFTIPTTGGPVKKISSNNDPWIFFGSLTWSPDGKTIYFDKQEKINTISMFENFKLN